MIAIFCSRRRVEKVIKYDRVLVNFKKTALGLIINTSMQCLIKVF